MITGTVSNNEDRGMAGEDKDTCNKTKTTVKMKVWRYEGRVSDDKDRGMRAMYGMTMKIEAELRATMMVLLSTVVAKDKREV